MNKIMKLKPVLFIGIGVISWALAIYLLFFKGGNGCNDGAFVCGVGTGALLLFPIFAWIVFHKDLDN